MQGPSTTVNPANGQYNLQSTLGPSFPNLVSAPWDMRGTATAQSGVTGAPIAGMAQQPAWQQTAPTAAQSAWNGVGPYPVVPAAQAPWQPTTKVDLAAQYGYGPRSTTQQGYQPADTGNVLQTLKNMGWTSGGGTVNWNQSASAVNPLTGSPYTAAQQQMFRDLQASIAPKNPSPPTAPFPTRWGAAAGQYLLPGQKDPNPTPRPNYGSGEMDGGSSEGTGWRSGDWQARREAWRAAHPRPSTGQGDQVGDPARWQQLLSSGSYAAMDPAAQSTLRQILGLG